jgi:hypothetical protein
MERVELIWDGADYALVEPLGFRGVAGLMGREGALQHLRQGHGESRHAGSTDIRPGSRCRVRPAEAMPELNSAIPEKP